MTSGTFLILENSQGRIVGLSTLQLADVCKSVSFFDMKLFIRMRCRKSLAHKCRKTLVEPDGTFPIGLSFRVKTQLEYMRVNFQIVDNRKRPNAKQIGLRQLIAEPDAYPEQTDCVKAFHHYESGIASLPTGFGKSRIIKDSILFGQRSSLIVTPSAILNEQTTEYLEDCFGSEFVGSFDPKKDDKPITVINFQSILGQDPRRFRDFGSLYLDEFHRAANGSIREAAKDHLSMFHKFAVTATNFTNDLNEAILLECVLSNTVYSMSIPYAIGKRYIKPVQMIMIELENEGLVEITKTNAPKELKQDNARYAANEKIFILNNEEKNQLADLLAKSMISKGIPVLTLVRKIEHGKRLSEGATFINGQSGSSKKNMSKVDDFNRLSIGHLVGTSVIGEGVNTKSCAAVINTAAGKSRKEFLQRLGRACRRSDKHPVGFFFDFFDKGSKTFKAQARIRMKTYEESYGMKVKIIKASQVQNALNP